MTNGLQCQYPFHLIGSSSLEGCVEKDSEAFLGLIVVIRDVLGLKGWCGSVSFMHLYPDPQAWTWFWSFLCNQAPRGTNDNPINPFAVKAKG